MNGAAPGSLRSPALRYLQHVLPIKCEEDGRFRAYDACDNELLMDYKFEPKPKE